MRLKEYEIDLLISIAGDWGLKLDTYAFTHPNETERERLSIG